MRAGTPKAPPVAQEGTVAQRRRLRARGSTARVSARQAAYPIRSESASFCSGPLGLPPAAEDQPPEGEAEAERPEREAADRERLAPRREALPATEGLSLLRRERLSAPLLAHRSTRTEAQVEIVEDLGG